MRPRIVPAGRRAIPREAIGHEPSHGEAYPDGPRAPAGLGRIRPARVAERREGQSRGVSRIREGGGRELPLPSRRPRKTAAVSSGVGPVLHGPRGTGRLRRRLHLDGRREAGGGDRGLPVLHEGPPPGRSVPLAVARQGNRRTGGRRRLGSREAGGGVEADPRRPRPGRLGRRPAPADAPLAEFTSRQTTRAGVDSPCACWPSPSIATRTPRAN